MNVAEARKNFPFWILWVLMILTVLHGFKARAQIFPVPGKPLHDTDRNIGYDIDGQIYFYWADVIGGADYHYNIYTSLDGSTFRKADERLVNNYTLPGGDSLTYWIKVAVANDAGAEGDLSTASNPVICDLTAPRITDFLPDNYAEGVLPNEDIQVTFSEQIKEDTLLKDGAIRVRVAGLLQDFLTDYETSTHVLTINPVDGIKNAVQYDIELSQQITDLAGNALFEDTSWRFQTEKPSQFLTSKLLNHPNPLGEGGTTFYYHLNLDADNVLIQIFSYAGSHIRTLDGSTDQGNQEVYWDGLDDFGDELPNGVYFYRLTALSDGQNGTMKASRTGRLMVLR